MSDLVGVVYHSELVRGINPDGVSAKLLKGALICYESYKVS